MNQTADQEDAEEDEAAALAQAEEEGTKPSEQQSPLKPIQWGDAKVGERCNDQTDCESRACDEWGLFSCKGRCVLADDRDPSKPASHNCPKSH